MNTHNQPKIIARVNGHDIAAGQELTFRTSDYEIADIRNPALAPYGRGRVNGDPIEDENGNVVYLILWCKREDREATNVFVHVNNLVFTPPSDARFDAAG